MKVTVDWKEGMSFEGTLPSGARLEFDPEGPTPMETLLAALAACSGMDVVSILQKKRQQVGAYSIEVTGERPPAGEHPRGFTTIHLTHTVSGQDLDPVAVARAVELSDEKYCSVAASLRAAVKISSSWSVEPA